MGLKAAPYQFCGAASVTSFQIRQHVPNRASPIYSRNGLFKKTSSKRRPFLTAYRMLVNNICPQPTDTLTMPWCLLQLSLFVRCIGIASHGRSPETYEGHCLGEVVSLDTITAWKPVTKRHLAIPPIRSSIIRLADGCKFIEHEHCPSIFAGHCHL